MNVNALQIFDASPRYVSRIIIISITLYHKYYGDRTKLLPYTNFYVEVLTQFRIKLLHVEVLTNFRTTTWL